MPEEILKDPVDRMNEVLIALNISPPNEKYAPEVYYPAFLDLLRTAKNNEAAKGFQAYLQPNKNALNKVSGTKDLEKFNQFMNAVDITKKGLKEALKDPEKVVEEAVNLKIAQAAQSQPTAAENKGFFARVKSFFNYIVSFFRIDSKVSPKDNSDLDIVRSSDAGLGAKAFEGSTEKKHSNNPADQVIQEINKVKNFDTAIKVFDEFFKDSLEFHKDIIVEDSKGRYKTYNDLQPKEKVNYISTLMTDGNRETFVAGHGDSDRKVLTDYIKQNMGNNSFASDVRGDENKSEKNFSN